MQEYLKESIYLYHEGTNYKSYKLFTPTKIEKNGEEGWLFRVWAPRARSVSVVGDFNNWDARLNIMTKITEEIFECFISNLKNYDIYKYSIEGVRGQRILKSDPYALHTETPPATASKIFDISKYKWNDAAWIKKRASSNTQEEPLNIYELHIGSWRRHANNDVFSYKDFAHELVDYIKKMNYTHVEFMPVTEYPYDGSWGYQVTGFFAPTSRFGNPADFMYVIDLLHQNNIGVILDLTIAHFPKDEHGLYNFDGDRLYEYQSELKCEHKEWGTRVFDYSRKEVVSFLLSSVYFWVHKYHIDGIRIDAVAAMLYLDYNRKHGEWEPNIDGGNYDLDAINFLKLLNTTILTNNKGVIMIAEESTAFPMVTKPPYEGGLGFNYKWNMGWMNDILKYIQADTYFRKDMHNNITFAISYAYSENYILPISHDEVVHGKKSLLSKFFGDYEDKFKALKSFQGYMMAHPGKKLNFMGNEFGQFIEWNYKKELDWFLLDYPSHNNAQKFTKAINEVYIKNSPLWELDNSYDGFKWICVDDNTQNVVSFVRFNKKGEHIIVVVNFSPVKRENYEMGVINKKIYNTILNTNSSAFGGSQDKIIKYKPKEGKRHNQEFYITMDIEPNSCVYLANNKTRKPKKGGKYEK